MNLTMSNQYQYYFAYGSNMDERQMAQRCPDAVKIGLGLATGYRFAIDNAGLATIEKDTRSYVEGVIWRVSESDVKSLDRYEGVRIGCYRKETIAIKAKSGNLLEALIYISNRGERPVGLSTASPYMDNILQSAGREGLRAEYLKILEAYARDYHSARVTV